MHASLRHRASRTLLALPVAGALLLAGCSSDAEVEPTAAPSATSDVSADVEPTEVASEEETEDVAEKPVATVTDDPNPFGIDFSQIDLPPELIATYGPDLAAQFAPDAAKIFSIFRNELSRTFVGARAVDVGETDFEVFRPYMTESAYESFVGSIFRETGTESYALLMNSTDPEGNVVFLDDEEAVKLDPAGPGITTSIVGDPTVFWWSREDGMQFPAIQFITKTTYAFESGITDAYGEQEFVLLPGENGGWVLENWWYEITSRVAR